MNSTYSITRKGNSPLLTFFIVVVLSGSIWSQTDTSYKIVDTGQELCYDTLTTISCPHPGESFYGQDAIYIGNIPSYTDNNDGTVTDLVTGLMWQKSPD